MNTESITWDELFEEIETNDEHCQQVASKSLKEWYTCSHHRSVQYLGAPGSCPLCFLKTILEEKQRIEHEIRTPEYQEFLKDLERAFNNRRPNEKV